MGLVHFGKKAAPSYALKFSSSDLDVQGSVSFGDFRQEIAGRGTAKGFMATKYLNIVKTRRVSGGFALGGGVAAFEASYTRRFLGFGSQEGIETKTYRRTYPTFEILGQADIRLAWVVSIGPYGGIRNGTLAVGGVLRAHF